MSISFGKRLAGFAIIAAAVLSMAPAGGAQPTAVFKPAASMILCQPGFVYRCGPHGCFCVKA
jgi:hypothetical protein